MSPARIKYNTTIVFFVSTLCLTALFLTPSTSKAATLELNPPSGTYVVGDMIPIDVLVDTEGASANAVSGDISYDSELLRARSISKNNSVVDLWIEEPAVKRGSGEVVFEGLILNPGLNGTGKIVTINFEVVRGGATDITITSGLILANDGYGTNIVDDLSGSQFQLVPARQVDTVDALPADDDIPGVTPSDEGLLSPVVISYTREARSLDNLSIRGVTYPRTPVRVYLQPKGAEEEVSRFTITSDSGGNFSFAYGKNAGLDELSVANVYSILSALAQPSTEETYQFWLTAVRDNIETEPTQPFEVIVSSGNLPLVIGGIAGLLFLLMLVGTVLVFRHRRQHKKVPLVDAKDSQVLHEVKRDVHNLAYDIEKYEAKERQDKQKNTIHIE